MKRSAPEPPSSSDTTDPEPELPSSSADRRVAEHAALSQAARKACSTATSTLVSTVSRHALSKTISFSDLATFHSAAKDSNRRIPQHDFVTASRDRIVLSSKFDYVSPKDISTLSTKRRRVDLDERQEAMRHRARESVKIVGDICPRLTLRELTLAEGVLERAVTDLRGTHGEHVVQSYKLVPRKLGAAEERPSLVIGIRLLSEIPVSVASLKKVLNHCWRDGVLTVDEEIDEFNDRTLPLTECGKVAKSLGNPSLILVTRIPN